jgi:folate-binding protein YgfZ
MTASTPASAAPSPTSRLEPVLGPLDPGGPEVPLHYSEPAEEYRALRGGAGLVDRSSGGRLEIAGADRVRFLNAYVTCDVKALAPGAGAYGFATSPQGRILTDFSLLAFEDRLWLELPAGQARPLADHLRKFIIADRVEIRELAEMVPLALAGPGAQAALRAAVTQKSALRAAVTQESALGAAVNQESALGATPLPLSGAPGADATLPAAPYTHARIAVAGVELTVQRTPRLGEPGFILWVPADAVSAVSAALLALPGVVPVGYEALEMVRVEAGVPRFGRDFGGGGGGGGGSAPGPLSFPQETGVEEAVSYTKGCYLGQEVVARIHYRGGVQKGLRGLVFPGSAPPPGTPLLFEGREAGVATSVVASPALGLHAGLAILHRRAAAAGTRLDWTSGGASGQAEVRNLPLAR